MPTNYPSGYDSFPDPTATTSMKTLSHSSLHIDVQESVEAIQAQLGLNPAGSYNTILEWLEDLDANGGGAFLPLAGGKMTGDITMEFNEAILGEHSSGPGSGTVNLIKRGSGNSIYIGDNSAGTVALDALNHLYLRSAAGGGGGIRIYASTVFRTGSIGYLGDSGTPWHTLYLRSVNSGGNPLTVKGVASQSGALTRWLDNNDTLLSWINAAGDLNFGTSGSVIGSTITMGDTTGNVTVNIDSTNSGSAGLYFGNNTLYGLWSDPVNSDIRIKSGNAYIATFAGYSSPNTLLNSNGATDVALAIQGYASQTGNLTEWTDSAGNVLAAVQSDGSIGWADGVGGAVDAGFLRTNPYTLRTIGSNVSSYMEFENWGSSVLTINGANNEDQTFAFSSTIPGAWSFWRQRNTTSGDFHLRDPAGNYVFHAVNDTSWEFPTLPLTIGGSMDVDEVPLTIHAATPNHTANLTEWQDRDDAVIASISAAPNLYIGNATRGLDIVTDGDGAVFFKTATAENKIFFKDSADNNVFGLDFSSSPYDFRPSNDSMANLGGTENDDEWNFLYLKGGILVSEDTSTTVPITVKAHASQTANLQKWQDSVGNDLVSVTASGQLTIHGTGTNEGGINVTRDRGTAATFTRLINSGDVLVCKTGSATLFKVSSTEGVVIPDSNLTITNVTGPLGVGSIGETLTLEHSSGNSANAGSFVGGLQFETRSSVIGAEIRAEYMTYGGSDLSLVFYTNDGSGSAEKMRISEDGYVGIGVDTPSVPLHVAGKSILGGDADEVPLTIHAATPSQTANLSEWHNDGATPMYSIGPDGYTDFLEQSEPAAPPTDTARVFAKDDGGGKTQLCVRFATGATQVLATEP